MVLLHYQKSLKRSLKGDGERIILDGTRIKSMYVLMVSEDDGNFNVKEPIGVFKKSSSIEEMERLLKKMYPDAIWKRNKPYIKFSNPDLPRWEAEDPDILELMAFVEDVPVY